MKKALKTVKPPQKKILEQLEWDRVARTDAEFVYIFIFQATQELYPRLSSHHPQQDGEQHEREALSALS